MSLRQTLLITGASSGIGQAIAELAAARGHTVIGSAPTQALLDDIPASAALKVVIDLCDQSSIDRALAAIDVAGLALSCLVNNAGFAQPGPIELVDDARVRRQFEVNVFGTLAMTRAALPRLRAQASPARHARIITMSSMLGLVASPYQGIYAASKHALEGAFNTLRMELRAQHIDVVLIEPGWITTGFLSTARTHAPASWLQHPVYGRALQAYFAIADDAQSDNPVGAARIAAATAGGAADVARATLTALEAPHPSAHYPVTAMAKWMPALSRLLPTRLWDRLQTGQFSP